MTHTYYHRGGDIDEWTVPVRDSTSPTGPSLSRRRMVWLLVGRGDLLPFVPGPLAAVVVLVAAWFTSRLVLITLVAGGIAFGGWALRRELRTGRGLRVTARSQPELAELVADTARRLGLPMPGTVWLTAGSNATALSFRFPRRHSEICFGVCSVSAMSGAELRATVAHELTHLTHRDHRRRRLVNRVLSERRVAARKWGRMSDRRRARSEGGGLARFLTETQPLAHAEELRADAAATRVVDAAVAAKALAREYAVGERFVSYVLRCVAPLIKAGQYPCELHSGWIAWCGTPAFFPEEFMTAATADADPLADEHPSLRARIGAYGAAEPAGPLAVPHPGGVLRPLRADEEAALSRHFARHAGLAPRFGWRRPRPVRWADVPDTTYDSCDSWLRAALTTAATGLLGRPARDSDVVDLIGAGRRAELQPELVSYLTDRAGDAATARACAAIPDTTLLAVMMYPRLRARGYRILDPTAQHLLTGPDADRLNLATTTARALADPRAFTRLRRWLFGPDPGRSGT